MTDRRGFLGALAAAVGLGFLVRTPRLRCDTCGQGFDDYAKKGYTHVYHEGTGFKSGFADAHLFVISPLTSSTIKA
jgi:hypothetical protein